MAVDTTFHDPFGDPFDTQQSVTPPIGGMKTKGNTKLLVVIFIIDCSMTMKGDRIAAVNAALQELKFKLKDIKEEHNLDMKVAVMSFTSSTKWDLQLTPVEEMNLEEIRVRPGLTEYGAAFHELNKVLRKDRFMQHKGKVAAPAIMFFTDGEPTDDYQNDLDELLKNGWFTNASRSAVLLGDAIYNSSARDAVRQFVEDPENEIVAAEDSTVIMQKLNLATMHTVAGTPIPSGGQDSDNASADFNGKQDPFGSASIDGDSGPSGNSSKVGTDDPFGGGSDAGTDDPFGDSSGAGTDDPFGDSGDAGTDDPFGDSGDAGTNDPFGKDGSSKDDDPFGAGGAGGDSAPFDMPDDDPFRSSADGGNDPFGGTDAGLPF